MFPRKQQCQLHGKRPCPHPSIQATHGWDLLGQLNRLDDGEDALLYGAFEVDILDLLAQVCLGRDEAYQAVLDRQLDVCPLLDGLLHGADGLDDEFFPSAAAGVSKLHDEGIEMRDHHTPVGGWEAGRRS